MTNKDAIPREPSIAELSSEAAVDFSWKGLARAVARGAAAGGLGGAVGGPAGAGAAAVAGGFIGGISYCISSLF